MSKYVEILFRHRLRFFILLVVLPAELAGACILLFPHQTAASSLWVENPAYIPVTQAAGSWNSYLTPAQNTADSLNQLRATDLFAQQVAARLELQHTFRDASERNSVLGTLTNDVSVLPTGSHIVVLTYTCPREPICSNALAAIEDTYHKWLTDEEATQARVAIDFYTGELESAQKKLAADQNAQIAYTRQNPSLLQPGVSSFDPVYQQLSGQVQQDLASVAALQQKLQDIRRSDAALGQLDSTVFQVVDAPRTTSGRLSALPRKQMAIAGIAAFVLGLGVLVVMAWSDRTTRQPSELENLLRLPVVAVVPAFARMEEAANG